MSVDAVNRSFSERLRLNPHVSESLDASASSFAGRLAGNHQLLENPYWCWSVEDDGHQNYVQVGRLGKYSPVCGLYTGLSVCKDVEAHKGLFFHGESCTGKIVAILNHLFCNSSGCSVCFIRGWSTRRARSFDGRIAKGVKRGYGKAEHVVVSPSVADRDLPVAVLKQKCFDALKDRGVTGGGAIFHGRRMRRSSHTLKWSVHFHFLGFIEGGFDRCRDCVHERGDCAMCDGFKGREVRGFAKDGYLVKVEKERKTIFGTAFYQLHHSTLHLGVRRSSPITWMGNCGYRCFRSDTVKAEVLCPVCRGSTVKCASVKRCIVKDIGSVYYVPCFLDDEFDEHGVPNFPELSGVGFG